MSLGVNAIYDVVSGNKSCLSDSALSRNAEYMKGDSSSAKPQERERKSRSSIVSTVLKSGELVELLYDPHAEQTSLLIGNSKTQRTQEQLQKSKDDILFPYSANNSLLKHRVILFPSQAEEYGSTEDLIADVRTYLRKYLSVSEPFEIVCAHYVLFSWIFDSFNEVPYLRVKGDYGSGKTRFLLTVGSICYKPMFASGASTISPLFHMLDIFQGTLIIDEADFRVSDDKAEIVKILNNGNARGFPVLRSEQSPTNEFRPRAFSVFGPKLVATRNRYEDHALESRFITEDMNRQSTKADIPFNLPNDQAREALTLRNKLLLYRLRHFTTARHVQAPKLDVEPRLAQIFSPLLSTVEDDSSVKGIIGLIVELNEELQQERRGRIEARTLEAIDEVHRSKKATSISIAAVCTVFQERFGNEYTVRITPRWIGSIIRERLGLRTAKRNGTYIIRPDDVPRLVRLNERFGVTHK